MASLPADEPSSRRRSRRNGWTLAASLGIPALLMASCATAFLTPHYQTGFSVGPAECVAGDETGYMLLQLPLAAVRQVDWYELDDLSIDGLTLKGVAFLPPEQSLGELDTVHLAALFTQLQAEPRWGPLGTTPTNLVLEFKRTPRDRPITVDSLSFSWAYGEPSYKQIVPLKLIWDGTSCTFGS